jgi:hypothetical protein
MRFAREGAGPHVRHPDLNGPQPLAAEALPMGPNLVTSGSGRACIRHFQNQGYM